MPARELPIRYLGIPFNDRSLRCAEFQGLVQKLVCKVQGWQARQLSYASRLCLKQSILCSIMRSWCSIRFIPQTILDQIQSVRRDYLRSGNNEYNHCPIAWPKEKGGLDFKEVLLWNKAFLSRYILDLSQPATSEESLLV